MFNAARDAVFLYAYRFNSPPSNSYSKRANNLLDFKLSGEVIYYWDDGKSLRSGPGNIVFIPQKVDFRTEVVVPGQYLEIQFSSSVSPEPELRLFTSFSTSEMEKLFNAAAEASYDKGGGGFFEAQQVIFRIFSILYKSDDRYINSKSKTLLEPSLKYMRENLFMTDFSLAEMRARSGISDTYFRRLFTKHFGISPKRYCIQERIQKAMAVMGLDPDLSLQAIADTTGFGDSYYFCRIFKKETGMTPGEYKKKCQSSHIEEWFTTYDKTRFPQKSSDDPE